MTYRADLDGLRALAVTMVIACHLGVGIPGGYIGVDLFFVLSGYLITRIIVQEHQERAFSVHRFIERRVRRIVPLSLFVVGVVWSAGYALLLPADFESLSRDAMAQVIMLGNVQAWRTTGYFAAAARERPLLHMWSLAVEEQFYLLWPVVVVVMLNMRHRMLLWAASVLWLGSFVLCVIASYRWPSANYFLLPTRGWELLTGCILAIVPRRTRRNVMWSAASVFSLACILGCALCFDERTRFPGISALLPVASSAILLRGGEVPGSYGNKLLMFSPLPFIGRHSYGLYLWHWPVIAFSAYWGVATDTLAASSCMVLLTVVLSTCSYLLLENPVRSRRVLPEGRQVIRAALGGGALVLAVAAAGASGEFPERVDSTALTAC
jgi:peptidoglycan/LPS O-acetylase OafA/YrhL